MNLELTDKIGSESDPDLEKNSDLDFPLHYAYIYRSYMLDPNPT